MSVRETSLTPLAEVTARSTDHLLFASSSPAQSTHSSPNQSLQSSIYDTAPIQPLADQYSTGHSLYQNYHLRSSTSNRYIPPPPGLGFPLRQYDPHSILKSDCISQNVTSESCLQQPLSSVASQQEPPKEHDNMLINTVSDDETYDLNQVGCQMAISVLD